MSDESSPPEQRLPDREADPRERADSIAPMSAPIVTIEETGAAISEPSPPIGVPGAAVPQAAAPEPASLEAAVLEAIAIEAAAVPEAGAAPRRLSPPPKPRSVPPSAEQQPYFAPPGFVSPLATSLRTEASEGSLPEQGTPRPSVPGTAPAASRPSTGSLPPTAVFPKASTRPPPTLPAGTRPSQYPWAVPATPETVIMRPRASSPVKSSPFDHVRTGVSSIPMSIREPVLPPARPSVRTGEPSLPSARRTTGQSPPTEGSGPALPPARRAASQPAPDETGEEASARGVVLPRALRDSGPPGARPPASKPRFVPQQLRKDTPAVAIQAMRIIAVGADDVPRSLVQRPAEARAVDTAPSVEHAREQVPTQQSPIQPALTPQADAQQVVPQPEPQELPPALPEAALLEVPPIPEEALQDVSQPMLVELEPATTVEVSSAAQELELYQLSAPPPEAIIVPQAIPDDDVAAIESQPEDAAAASVRKRPPPPKRVSVPSAAGESQPEEVTFTAPVGAPSERPVPAARPVASTPSEAAPRQPPPAPSRVPRDSVPKQLAKPEPVVVGRAVRGRLLARQYALE